MSYIEKKRFSEINLADPFFDSLKKDYVEFEQWFNKKATKNADALILSRNEKDLDAFLYLKIEDGEVNDVVPALPTAKRLKVGTFKVNAIGTKLGERFIKKIFDYAIYGKVDEIYLTVFSKHTGLIEVLKRYGFEHVANKTTANGTELVMIKTWAPKDNMLLDYPRFNINANKYLLSIYPEFHTRLFPDSILNNENYNLLEDVSHTNSIHKVYICFMDVSVLKRGDLIAIYRTNDGQGPAFYRSVVTSICVVDEVRTKNSFASFVEYLAYCQPYSVFSEAELLEWFNKKTIFTIKMTYNAAIEKRLTRGNLIETVGVSDKLRWGFLQLSDDQFEQIIKLGKVNESLIIH